MVKKGAAIAVADIHTARAEETVSLCLKAGAKEAFFIALNVQHAEDFEKARHTLLSRWGLLILSLTMLALPVVALSTAFKSKNGNGCSTLI